MIKRLLVAAACVVAIGTGAAQFEFFSSKHAVGECVRTTVTLGGMDIRTVDCPLPGRAAPFSNDPLYRITHVLDIDASCPLGNLFGVQLAHEPDDAVYCLSMVL